MPAQPLDRAKEKVAVVRLSGGTSLPPNSSSAELVKRKEGSCGLLEPEFRGSGAGGGHITTRQWVTVAVLVYVNLINYMDRLTLAGELEQIQKLVKYNLVNFIPLVR